MKPTNVGNVQPLSIGEVIESPDGARYRVLRRIGAGGYSVVFEVLEENSNQHFAMKVLQLAHANDPMSVERARREGTILFRIQHANVVRVHAFGIRNDGIIWLILDLLVGRTLRQLLVAMNGRIPVPMALDIVAQVCAGLAAIHRLGLIHRDIKPENIHVREDGELVRLFDLGAVKGDPSERKTTAGFTVGTVAYMSPEQVIAQKEIDASSDVFSIGTLLYELLSGIHPFDGHAGNTHNQEIGRKILFSDPVRLRDVAPFVPAEIEEFVHKCLKKKRIERYPSAAVLHRILTAATKEYLARHPSASLKDIMPLLPPSKR